MHFNFTKFDLILILSCISLLACSVYFENYSTILLTTFWAILIIGIIHILRSNQNLIHKSYVNEQKQYRALDKDFRHQLRTLKNQNDQLHEQVSSIIKSESRSAKNQIYLSHKGLNEELNNIQVGLFQTVASQKDHITSSFASLIDKLDSISQLEAQFISALSVLEAMEYTVSKIPEFLKSHLNSIVKKSSKNHQKSIQILKAGIDQENRVLKNSIKKTKVSLVELANKNLDQLVRKTQNSNKQVLTKLVETQGQVKKSRADNQKISKRLADADAVIKKFIKTEGHAYNKSIKEIQSLIKSIEGVERHNLEHISSMNSLTTSMVELKSRQQITSENERKHFDKVNKSILELNIEMAKTFGGNNENVKYILTLLEPLSEEFRKFEKIYSDGLENLSLSVHQDVKDSSNSILDKVNSFDHQLSQNLKTELHSLLTQISSGRNTDRNNILIKLNETQERLERKISSLENQLSNLIENSSHLITDGNQNIQNSLEESRKEIIQLYRSGANENYGRLEGIVALYNLLDPEKPLPSLNDWAISSDLGLYLYDKVLKNDISYIFDIGAGSSTLIMAYALKQKGGGKIVSLENNLKYYESVLQEIEEHGLSEYCEVHLAPLEHYHLKKQDWLWYDLSKVKSDKKIDLIFVDGPWGGIQSHSRYPALPLLKKWLKPETLIVLDDTKRKDEREIADRWSKEFNLSQDEHNSHKGFIELSYDSAGNASDDSQKIYSIAN